MPRSAGVFGMFVSKEGLRRPGGDARVASDYAFLANAGTGGVALLQAALGGELRGRVAVVSSFGAESVLLLALVAAVDRATPVLFLDTDQHFPETLAHRAAVVGDLGLTDVRDLHPDRAEAADTDPTGELWHFDPDACCALRKVRPLARALHGFNAWITGRKRHQSPTREQLPFVERAGDQIKINPLADWDAPRIEAEIARRGLPRHPLVASGYRSIGCAPCTRAVTNGEDARAGRWAGLRKVECGIHLAA